MHTTLYEGNLIQTYESWRDPPIQWLKFPPSVKLVRRRELENHKVCDGDKWIRKVRDADAIVDTGMVRNDWIDRRSITDVWGCVPRCIECRRILRRYERRGIWTPDGVVHYHKQCREQAQDRERKAAYREMAKRIDMDNESRRCRYASRAIDAIKRIMKRADEEVPLEEAAKMLPSCPHTNALRRMALKKKLPAVRYPGGKWKVRVRDLLPLVQSWMTERSASLRNPLTDAQT